MITDTRKVFALAALIVATGVATVELTRNTAQAAEQGTVMTLSAAYAAARVDTAFDLIAALPPGKAVMVPMAQKGDLLLPAGCSTLSGDAQAECMDVAYELPSPPSVVVETRDGTTSTLLRMDPITLAGVSEDALQQSE
jgi:hypothetical protein